jgi:sulfur carrier protein ThiS
VEYDRNSSDSAFEEVNQDYSPVFQVIYSRPNVIRVNGIFVKKEHTTHVVPEGEPVEVLVVFGKNETVFTSRYNSDMRQFMLQYKPFTLFKYPAYAHRGKYRDG